ncbi:MAG: diguanylate cyclase, partial [Treponema sp.]|nr:diguanylate cyclase [Treponema sp.]
MSKSSRNILLYISLVIGVAAFIIFSFIHFEKSVSNTVKKNSTNYLKDTAFLYAGTFQVKLNDQLFMLESQARYFQDVDMDDYNAVKSTIISTKGVGEFKRIAVANVNGMTINYNGKSSGNIMMKGYFREALKGKPQISSTISVDEDGENVLTLAVPIFQEEKVVGVITGTFSYSVLESIFSVDTFGGAGYNIISDKAGNILIGTKSPKSLCSENNWIDFFINNKHLSPSQLSEINSTINQNRTGVFNFTINDEQRIVAYTPVGLNDWYVLSALPADYILSQQNTITMITFRLIFTLLFVFIIITFFVAQLIRQNERVKKDNTRYAINSETNQTLIFEYDYAKDTIEFTGNTKSVFGETFKRLPLSQFHKISSKIHETEKGLILDVRKAAREKKESYTTELRIKIDEKGYVWYKLSGTLIYNESREPVKFIGNIINVNEQVIHEQKLKTMAETDLLSGLLNKICMESRISSFLTEKKESHKAAFFIIDLDNFKQVNDKLGHTYGDQVICDTAKKLSLVFSEKDLIGRIGGDEFCVLLCLKKKHDPRPIAEEKARTLREILAEIYSNGEESVEVTPSIGISLFPAQGLNHKELFKMADSALYHVKKHGKNDFAF